MVAYRESRFEVRGYRHHVPVRTVFKTRHAACRFADQLSKSEVYDLQENVYIYGSSLFIQKMIRRAPA